jgi:manganese efflux pump family protein
MHFSFAFSLSALILVLPLGLDTLGVSLSLGMKSASSSLVALRAQGHGLPPWLRTALLFALAETLMPIIGLLIGAALSSLISEVMHYLGALLLIGLGAWEFVEEGREYLRKRKKRAHRAAAVEPSQSSDDAPPPQSAPERFQWGQQLLLALSVSLDELAVGFSFGSLKNITLSPVTLCVLIGLQGFLMALIGLALGRTLRFRLKALKEWSELLSAALLIGLGIWFLFA